MNTYLISMQGIEGNVLVKYSLNGDISCIEIKCELKPSQASWILSTIPPREEMIMPTFTGTKKISVTMGAADLSFDTFWNTYNYKMGKKDRVKKIWELYTEEEKIKAMEAVVKYNRYLSGKKIEKCYPETYLSQRRWENQF